jgi:hypothetical protein
MTVSCRTFDRAATEEERDLIAACHEQLINKMHTVQGMDDIDAKFKRVLDISVSGRPCSNLWWWLLQGCALL